MRTLFLQILILLFGTLLSFGQVVYESPTGEIIPERDALSNYEFGIVTVSVANGRMEAGHRSEMGTQLLLGMPVRVIEQRGSWWQVKTPENYVIWLERRHFQRMNREDFNRWTSARKVIFTDDFGFVYEQPNERGQRVSNLVLGNLMKYEGENRRFFRVSFPDGRKGYVPKRQAMLFDEWKKSINLTENSIIQTALSMKGIPYLWGGTSIKGMDCSGFTKTVFLMHGIITLRDARQQAQTGIPVDISTGYENLRRGDLMFFGREATEETPGRIRHVAIYMGNKEFIHAAGLVRVNSLDPNEPHFDELNTREFIRATRIIGAVGTEGLWCISVNPLYRVQE